MKLNNHNIIIILLIIVLFYILQKKGGLRIGIQERISQNCTIGRLNTNKCPNDDFPCYDANSAVCLNKNGLMETLGITTLAFWIARISKYLIRLATGAQFTNTEVNNFKREIIGVVSKVDPTKLVSINNTLSGISKENLYENYTLIKNILNRYYTILKQKLSNLRQRVIR